MTTNTNTAGEGAGAEAPSAVPLYVPERLQHLTALFSALEFGLSSLSLYQRAADFPSAKRAVESSTQRFFAFVP